MDWETRYNQLMNTPANSSTAATRANPLKKESSWETRYNELMKSRTTKNTAQQSAQKSKYAEAESDTPAISALGAGSYGADKHPDEGYSYGQGLAKAGLTSLGNVAQMLSTPLSQGEQWIGKGLELITGKEQGKGLFERWDDSIKAEQQAVAAKYAENTEKGGKYAEKLEELEQSVFEALPSLGVALATGGSGAAAKAADLAAQTAGKTSAASIAKQGAKSLMKDPNFITSAMQIYSGSYNNAKAEGASELQATAYALANAGLGSYVEIQGGLQKLPKALQGDETFLKALAKTMLEEGTEEVEQGVIDRALQRVGYGADNPLLGMGENGIIDPVAAAEEFTGGAIVGGLLGGGTMGINAAVNGLYNRTQQAMQEEAAPTQSQQVKNVSMEAQPTEVQAVPTVQAADLGAEAPIVRFESADAETPAPTAGTLTARKTGGNTKGFGENGQAAYANVQSEYGSDSATYQGFAVAYNAGLSGVSPSLVQTNVPETVRSAAYQAGLNDRVANMRKSNEAVKRVTVKKGAGLLRNEYASKLTESNKDIADTLNIIGKDMGVSIEIVDSVAGGRANGEYNADTSSIWLAMDAENPILTVTAHEVTHRIETLSPTEYETYCQAAAEYYTEQYGAESVTALVNAYKQVARDNGVTLTNKAALDEMAADFTETLLNDADLFGRFAKENRTAAQKLLDALKEFIAKVKAALTGKARDAAAQSAYGKNFSELEQIAQKWQTAYDAATERAKNVETAANEGSGVRYQIKQLANGMKYVQADRQVTFGNDPVAWSKQLENYINGKIRHGENVQLIAEDGDILTLTAKSAGKLSSRYTNNGRTMSEEAFERKANAAAHIDELVQVSRRGKRTVFDEGSRHGSMAENGWNYRTAYFRDFDGTYYRATISVAQGADGNMIYNIGQMKKEAFPKIEGSYAVSGNDPRGNTSQKSAQSGDADISTAVPTIRSRDGNVNSKFSLKGSPTVDSTGRELSPQQQEYFKDSKVRDAEGRLLKLYHQTEGGFTVFDTKNTGAGRSDGETPFGIFLKSNSGDIGLRGKTQMELYANITNPLYAENREDLSRKVEFLSPEYARIKQEHRALDAEYGAKVENAKREWVSFITEWRKNNPDAPRTALYDVQEFNRLFDAEDVLIQEWTKRADELSAKAKETITNALRKTGYDGVVLGTDKGSFGRSTDAFIALDPEQVKNVDNVSPTGDADIRYSLKGSRDIEQELKDLKKERTRLASRNKALEQRVEDLKGEMRITREPTLVAKDVQKLGRQIIQQYDSDAKYSDIERDMDALAKAIMKKDVSMSDLMPHAKSAAETIIDNTTYMTEDGQFLREIRQYLRDHIVVLSDKPHDYDYIRKKYAGTLYLATQVGQSKTKHYIGLDVLYEDMAEMFGEAYFPADVYGEENKLERIIEVVDALSDNSYANPYDGYREIAANDLAGQLIDGIISEQVRQKRTFADKKAFEQQEAVGRVRQLLTKEREKRKTRERELKQQFAGKTREIREKQSAKEMRQRIAKHTSALSDKLLHPTDNKHIPEVLRKPVAELLNSINLESAYSYDENGRLRKDANGDPTQRTLAAVKLRKAYSQVMQGDDAVTVDPALLEEGGLLDTVERLSDKRVADMTTSELQTVWEAIRAIEASISSYNRTLSNGKYQKISDWAERIKSESSTRKRRNRSLSLELLDPYSFFTAYGDAGKQVYRTLRDAQDLEHVRVRELTERSKKVFDKDVYKQRNERHEYTTERGDKVTLTTAQLMNLYNLARRGEQAMNHLMVGGIAQPEIERNGKQKAIPRGEANIPLTEGDIRAMTDMLTPEQKKMADGYQKLASSLLAEWGNEASMQVYGYRKFTEKNYWPIRVSKEATMQNAEKTGDTSREIKNMGSAKALVPNASNALDIGSIYDVFSQNASDMVKYSTLLAPMEDINRLFNYRYRDGMGNLTNRNFKQVLTSAYGDKAQKYWLNLMRDVQNGLDRTSSESSKVVERLVSNAKAAAVGANLRVVIQQPTAIVRAAAILNPENMARGLKSGATKGNGWEKAKKYAPIASIKNTAGFDQGGRYTIAHELYGAEGWMEQLNDATSWAAAKADAVTWGKIWNACEWQVAEDTTLKKGSEEFYSEVAKLFTEVIDQSQVVDGIMQRPAIMRDGNAAVKQATAFMGEPLKAVNMLVRAYDAWVYETDTKKRSEALKTLKRSVSALAATTIVNALAQSIVDALRDDDKDEKYMERLLTSLTGVDDDEENTFMSVMSGNIASGFNPLEYIPIAKDAWSILQGYSVDRMDAELISDFVSAVQAFGKAADGQGKKTTAYAAKQLISATAKVFGISATNAGRDIWAIARSVAIETGNVRMMYEMERAIYRIDKTASNRSVWCTLLYMAQNKGDNETARLIYKDMLANGYEEKDVRQGVETIMKKEQGVSSVDDLKSRWKAPY